MDDPQAPQASYKATSIPVNESDRLAALRSYGLLDTDPEQVFDDMTDIASLLCDTPIALVTLVDDDRQWFMSKLLARWGDHAFGVLLPDTDDAGALHMAERLRTGVEQASGPDGPVTVSIGASSALAHSDASPYELLTRSDRALSACKAEGCNRSQLFIGPYW